MGFSALWKLRARQALRGRWQTALLIALIVNLPTLLVQGIASFTGNDLLYRVQDALLRSLGAGGSVNMEALSTSLQSISDSTGIWVMQGLQLVALLLTPCLTLGMVSWLLDRLRGRKEDPGITSVFSRLRLFFPGIGLRLYTLWRVFVFTLPGVALNILAWLPMWLQRGSSSDISRLSSINTSVGLQTAAMFATLALALIGFLRYALGDMALADSESPRPIKAAKESKRLTNGRRAQLFSLYISFIFWYLLQTLVAGFTLTAFGEIISLMVQMLCQLAISVYLNASVCAFYLECRGEAVHGIEETGEEAEDPQDPPLI